jgi:hypothetical protein
MARGVLTHHPMHGAYTLAKPIVAVPVGTSRTTTLPSGARVEIPHDAHATLVQVIWQQRSFVVHLPDLLDACRVEDVGEITSRGGLGSASDDAE